MDGALASHLPWSGLQAASAVVINLPDNLPVLAANRPPSKRVVSIHDALETIAQLSDAAFF